MVKYEQAVEIINSYEFKPKTEYISSFDSLGYVLAEDITSNINVPSFRKSAMDGYALLGPCEVNKSYQVIDTIYAGDCKNPLVNANQCVRIMTGAKLPDNLNQVVVQELADQIDNTVTFNLPPTKLNANICQIGEDIEKGQLLFKQGDYIKPTTISSLISCGISTVKVYSKPNILLITTGDEVTEITNTLNDGQIYNSNLAYLRPRLMSLGFGCQAIHLTDNIELLDDALNDNYDLIITTGAISVGEKDIFRNYINRNQPKVLFDRVNIMPGGPVVFWEENNTPIVSLAGSPFANFVTFELFARLILAKLTNDSGLIPTQNKYQLTDSYTKDIKKRRFIKAKLENNKVTIPASNHLASSMHEMCLSNCLINLERGKHNLKPGDIVDVIELRRNDE